jgi:IS30 family transposase
MPCHQLTVEEREVISQSLANTQMHYSGARASPIAQRLRRSPSTIGRELRRNGGSSGYRAVAAQEQTPRRRVRDCRIVRTAGRSECPGNVERW